MVSGVGGRRFFVTVVPVSDGDGDFCSSTANVLWSCWGTSVCLVSPYTLAKLLSLKTLRRGELILQSKGSKLVVLLSSENRLPGLFSEIELRATLLKFSSLLVLSSSGITLSGLCGGIELRATLLKFSSLLVLSSSENTLPGLGGERELRATLLKFSCRYMLRKALALSLLYRINDGVRRGVFVGFGGVATLLSWTVGMAVERVVCLDVPTNAGSFDATGVGCNGGDDEG